MAPSKWKAVGWVAVCLLGASLGWADGSAIRARAQAEAAADPLAVALLWAFQDGSPESLLHVARGYAETGREDRAAELSDLALDMALAMPPGERREGVVGLVAATRPLQAPDRMWRLIQLMDNADRRDLSLSVVILRLLEAGRPADAEALLPRLRDRSELDHLYAELAPKHAEQGEWKKADAAAKQTTKPYFTIQAQLGIGAAYRQTGRPKDADRLFGAALKTAQRMRARGRDGKTAGRVDVGLIEIVTQWMVDAGAVEQAMQFAESFAAQDPEQRKGRAACLAMAADRLARAGQKERAAQAADEVVRLTTDGHPLSFAAAVLAELGQAERARAAAAAADTADGRFRAMMLVARAGLFAGRRDDALTALAAAEKLAAAVSRWERNENRVKVAAAYARAGEKQKADELLQAAIAEETGRSVNHDAFYSRAARRFAELEQIETAQRLAETIADPEARGQDLAIVASGYVEHGKLEPALAVVRQMRAVEPSVRTMVLTYVAVSAAAQKLPLTDADKRLLAELAAEKR